MGVTHTIKRFELGHLDLQSGDRILDAFLTYSTHGTLNPDKSNAILVLPSFMANHTRHDFLIGPGKALDPEHHFIITTDTLGNGWAISPSNSRRQPGTNFPRFTVLDMVRAQHRLVDEVFDIPRLVAVVGLSMGGMQAFQWACAYPERIDAMVAIISQARMTPWVKAIWQAMRQPIMAAGSDETHQRQGLRHAIHHFLVMTRHWDWYQKTFGNQSDDALMGWIEDETQRLAGLWHPLDFVAQTHAQAGYDLGASFAGPTDLATALQSVKARALLMPASTDILHPAAELHHARGLMAHAQLIEIDSICGHMGGGGLDPRDVELMDHTIRAFLHKPEASG